MESSLNIISILLFFGAFQGVLLSLALFTIKRENRIPNRILAVILLIFSFTIGIHTASHSLDSFNFPNHDNILLLPGFLFGPLLFLYVRTLTIPGARLKRYDLLHFLPFVVCASVVLPFYYIYLRNSNVTAEKVEIHQLLGTFVILHVITYIVLAIKLLHNHTANIKRAFSSIEKINLKWLRFLIAGFIIIWLTASIFEANIIHYETFDFVWLIVCIFMYLIGYKALKQPEIFSGIRREDLIYEGLIRKKYKKSTLTPEKARKLLEKLKNSMETEKPYLDSTITLPVLAKKLCSSTHHLSQVINENFHQNFYEFINGYRVEEAKDLIAQPQNKHVNLASLGLDAGFNSISSFNAAFKKHTGMTPSQYRDSLPKLSQNT